MLKIFEDHFDAKNTSFLFFFVLKKIENFLYFWKKIFEHILHDDLFHFISYLRLRLGGIGR